MAHDTVTIHIDKHKYESPSPTTGQALYTLGHVAAGFVLFREVHGPGDDERVQNDTTEVSLENGQHFYSAKDELNPGND